MDQSDPFCINFNQTNGRICGHGPPPLRQRGMSRLCIHWSPIFTTSPQFLKGVDHQEQVIIHRSLVTVTALAPQYRKLCASISPIITSPLSGATQPFRVRGRPTTNDGLSSLSSCSPFPNPQGHKPIHV